ncbi:MAG: M23 family metallopeptidase [Rhodospirillales bacterium]|nr:M23 family metallopeptidase [Rhodospirillales bacterium]MCB9995296.1 M23 family metallopeptidase [Rhodospirillales bacterium]
MSACGTSKPAPVINYGIDGGATSAGVHTVSKGDSLWSIAQRYRLDMKDVVVVNNLHAPYFLEAGDRLTLPPPNSYKVKAGDNIYDVSRTFNVSMTQLVRQNQLREPYRIRPGDMLRLPSVQPAYQPAPAARTQVAMVTPGQKPDGPVVQARPVTPVQKSLPVTTKTPPRSSGKFSWPVDGPVISTYGPKRDGLHNDGVNIRAAKGAPVRAAENGVIVYADNQLSGFGNLVLVRHADRWMTAYGHMDRTTVRRGQQVRRGETLGLVGASGSVDSPQLHFEIRRGTEALNPELYLARQGS